MGVRQVVQEDVFEQLLAIFRDEAHEELDELRQLVGSLIGLTGTQAAEAFGTAMRLAHSLKGASCTVGLEDMSRLAHVLEDVLLGLQDGTLTAPRESALEAAGRSVEVMVGLVDGIPVDASRAIASLLALVPSHESTTESVAPVRDNAPQAPKRVAASTGSIAEPSPYLTEAGDESHQDASLATKQRAIRVAVERIDELVRQAGELLATHAESAELHAELEELGDEFQSLLDELGLDKHRRALDWFGRLESHITRARASLRRHTRLTSELTGAVRRMRMVPVSAFAATFRRCVADAAQQTHHDVDLELVGGEVELDKQVLDRIVEPMLHLLRNAVDHGIEAAEDRSRGGKRRRGRVLMTARLSGDIVELAVHDDGRGFDLERIRAAAEARALRSKEQLSLMTDAELLDLMFATGFSTAGHVSQISGRGLGLDVVRRSVEECGGRVELSVPGRLGGASFLLLLPVNVLSVHSLLVRSGQGVYAIPIDTVERTLRFLPSEVRANGREFVLDVEGQPLHLHDLATLLGKHTGQTQSRGRPNGIAVVLRRAGRVLAAEVDEVIADQEYAITRLPWNFRSVPGVAGVVALPDSQVAVALDVGFLLRRSGEALRSESSAQAVKKTRILVADDSLTARTLAKNALSAAGYSVTAVVDGLKAWQILLREDFALLVSDVRMPNLTGIELTERVRSHERLRTMPVVLITTESTPEDIQRGLSAGADEYVIKGPMQQQKLLDAIARHV